MGFFSRKDKSKSPAPPQSLEEQQRDDPNARDLFGDRKSPAPTTDSSSSKSNPYAAANPYAASQPPKPSPYSNPNPAPPSGPDPNASALFGNRQPNPSGPPPSAYGREPTGPPPAYDDGTSEPSGSSAYSRPPPPNNNSSYTSAYAADPSDQLTQEEEDEEVEAIKQQIRFTKQESVASTRNALRYAAQAEETGRSTLMRLGEQGERLYNTERHLDVARSHNQVAEDKSRELKKLNGSMFAIHMKNPMKSKKRAEDAERKILEKSEFEREERELNRAAAYDTRRRVGEGLKAGNNMAGYTRSKASMAERSKYQVDGGDEEDDALEDEIDNNLDQLGQVAGRLKALAVATGEETDRQNQKIAEIMKKSDRVDDQIALTHNRIKRIR